MIDVLRNQIDAIDLAIANLVLERAAISRRIQGERIDTGGSRVDISRERDVRVNYRSHFPADGGYLADVILQICKRERA